MANPFEHLRRGDKVWVNPGELAFENAICTKNPCANRHCTFLETVGEKYIKVINTQDKLELVRCELASLFNI